MDLIKSFSSPVVYLPITLIVLAFLGLRFRPCIFCKIAQKKIKSNILYEDEMVMCIQDISPAGKHHYLIIPKQHIKNIKHLTKDHIELVELMTKVGRQVLESKLDKNEKFSMGFVRPPFNSVDHLHLHCVSQPLTCSSLRRWVMTSSWSFVPIMEVRRTLNK